MGTIAGMGTTQLIAAGVGVEDEIVVPAFGGDAAAEAVLEAGARPVFADVDARTLCLEPGAAEAAITDRTVCIAVLHLFGCPADLAGLREIAERRGVRLVEFGARPSCSALDAVRRRQHANFMRRRLRGVDAPSAAIDAEHVYTEYVVRVPGNGRPDRDAFMHALRGRGVAGYVPVRPVHRLRAFRRGLGLPLPESERAFDECLALPMRASLTRRELSRMVAACNALGGLVRERVC